MNFDDLYQTDDVLFLRYAVGLMQTENLSEEPLVGIWEAHGIRICWGVPHPTSSLQIWLVLPTEPPRRFKNHCLTRNAGLNSEIFERLEFARSYMTYLRNTGDFEKFDFRTIALITAILAWTPESSKN